MHLSVIFRESINVDSLFIGKLNLVPTWMGSLVKINNRVLSVLWNDHLPKGH
jgi:hypothetical protein